MSPSSTRKQSPPPHERRSGRLFSATVGVGIASGIAVWGFGSPKAAASPPTRATVSAAGPRCGARIKPGSTSLHLTVDGYRRLVIVHVPQGYTGRTHVPLVLNLHGSGSDARQQELLTGMDASADRDGFIVAYPQALIPESGGFGWNVPDEPLTTGAYPPKGAADDVTFLTGLPAMLAGRYCVDLLRVYVTGISGGGRMASQLACDAPSTFTAVAPVAGLRFPGPCDTARAVPVLAFHGTADPIDPYGGDGLGYWTYSVPVAAERWSAQENCGPGTVTNGKGYKLTAYTHCAGGSSIELYTVLGEGHEWPGGPKLPAAITRVLGPQSDAVNANSTMWRFFSAYALS